MELLGKGKSLAAAAAKADMDEKTARKYRELDKNCLVESRLSVAGGPGRIRLMKYGRR